MKEVGSFFSVFFGFGLVGDEDAGQIWRRGVGTHFRFFEAVSEVWREANLERAEFGLNGDPLEKGCRNLSLSSVYVSMTVILFNDCSLLNYRKMIKKLDFMAPI